MDNIQLTDIIKSLPALIAKAPRASRALPVLNRNREFLSLGKIIEYSAKKYGHKDFIYFEDRKISYKEFNDFSNKIAHYLAKQGIHRGDVVALLFDNRPEFLMCAVAVVKLGAIAALLNPFQRGQVLLHSIELVKSRAIIVGEELVREYQTVRNKCAIEDKHTYFLAENGLLSVCSNIPAGYLDLAKESYSFPDTRPAALAHVHRLDSCFYIYTSGTTGMPKASITNHDRWLAAYAGIGHGLVQLKSKDVFYCALPFYHATAMLVCWGSILAGGSAFVLKRKFSASEFWHDVFKYKVTAFGYVGELCRYLLNQETSPQDRQHKIRLVLGNGLRPSVWKAFKQRFGIPKVIEFYAASEGNVGFVNLFNLDCTIGLGSHNLAVVKYDQENEKALRNKQGFMEKVTKGEAGLLLGEINKLTPFPGYTDKNQTQKAIFRNVFKEGDQWFNTGDMVKNIGWHHYQFVDRLGDTFRWKGENVSTTELENIALQFEGIEDCTAYGVEIPDTNGRAGMLCIHQKSWLDLNELLAFFKAELPAYAIPRFIRLKDTLETTGTFKHKKAELKEQGFHIDKVSDALYVLLPPANEHYIPIDKATYTGIMSGSFRF